MKRIAVITILALMLVLAMPLVAAASTCYIDITATGSEIDITCNCTVWAIGTVGASENISTSQTYCYVLNETSQPVTITVHGNEMVDVATGAGTTWTMSATGTPGAATFGLRIGVDDTGNYWDVLIKDFADNPYNTMKYDADTTLGASDNWSFGFNFLSPTSGVGNEAMVMSDDGGTDHAQGDADNGVVLIATI
jgi:hypothetical protein